MSFASAVEHLHALGHELAAPTAPRRKFDLDHMRILARALGSPQHQFPAVLIAGTNGKGSTGATLAAILAAAGYRTGLYTSPHLTRVTERIRVSTPRTSNLEPRTFSEIPQAGAPHLASEMWDVPPPTFAEIPEEDFARLYFRIDDVARNLVSTGQLPNHPSFFETLTALAFLYFAEQRLDMAILEVGMGGRLDATNIVEPVLSVITDIALDHQDYLGSTIAAIAREKAGILRPNGTLITLPQHPEANHAIGEAAIALNVHAISATDYLPGRNFTPLVKGTASAVPFSSVREEGALAPESGAPSMTQSYRGMGGVLPENHYDITLSGETLKVRSPLAGEHQQRNIALAIAAAIELRNYFSNKPSSTSKSSNQSSHNNLEPRTPLEPRTSNLEPQALPPGAWNPVPVQAIELGITSTSWPGRLEFLPPNLLLDVAHNPAGAWTLRAAIASLPEDLPRTLIFSCLRDKDLTEMAQILFPLFDASTSEIPGNPTPSTSEIPGNPTPSTAELPGNPRPSAPELLGNPRLQPWASVQSHEAGALAPGANPISNLEPRTLNLILTPINSPRAASLEDLLSAARKLDIPAHPAENPIEALALARSLTPANGLILATGSIYLVGALREQVIAP